VVHVAKENVGKVVLPTVVGKRVTVGHGSTLHACTLQDESFVGMGATIMDGAVVRAPARASAAPCVSQGTTRRGAVRRLGRAVEEIAAARAETLGADAGLFEGRHRFGRMLVRM